MDQSELTELERAIQTARTLVEQSRSELIEIEQFLAQARSAGHSEWETRLIERRSDLEKRLLRAREGLSRDEDTYRQANAN